MRRGFFKRNKLKTNLPSILESFSLKDLNHLICAFVFVQSNVDSKDLSFTNLSISLTQTRCKLKLKSTKEYSATIFVLINSANNLSTFKVPEALISSYSPVLSLMLANSSFKEGKSKEITLQNTRNETLLTFMHFLHQCSYCQHIKSAKLTDLLNCAKLCDQYFVAEGIRVVVFQALCRRILRSPSKLKTVHSFFSVHCLSELLKKLYLFILWELPFRSYTKDISPSSHLTHALLSIRHDLPDFYSHLSSIYQMCLFL